MKFKIAELTTTSTDATTTKTTATPVESTAPPTTDPSEGNHPITNLNVLETSYLSFVYYIVRFTTIFAFYLLDDCKERTKKKQCYLINDRAECLVSKDNRQSYRDQPCVWCPNGPCEPSIKTFQCEPKSYLEDNGIGSGFEECYREGITRSFH